MYDIDDKLHHMYYAHFRCREHRKREENLSNKLAQALDNALTALELSAMKIGVEVDAELI